MRKKTLETLIALVVVAAALMALRFLFLGRLSRSTQADYVSIAQGNRFLVQAAYDFKADHGLWPQSLGDLYPAYLSKSPANPRTMLCDKRLTIPADEEIDGAYVVYSFDRVDEGWMLIDDPPNRPLPLPKVIASRPALTGDAMIAARLAEYDRRIRAAPGKDPYFIHHDYAQKIAFLVSLGRKADVITTCRGAAIALPNWWRPPMTLAEIAGPDDAAQAEAGLQAWIKSHPTFTHYWYLSHHYRGQGRSDMAVSALQEAANHTLEENDPDASWSADAYAFDAATFACQQHQPALVLKIIRQWELWGTKRSHNDNLHAFKAAAELTLGELDEASADMNKVKAAAKTQYLWAGNLDQLDHAVLTQDQTFVYDPGNFPTDWKLFPAED
jgi:hypothetical protein